MIAIDEDIQKEIERLTNAEIEKMRRAEVARARDANQRQGESK